MTAEQRHALIREMEVAGFSVHTRDERGLLMVEVRNLRDQVVASAVSTQRFDIALAWQRWKAWQHMNRQRAVTRTFPERKAS